MNITLSISLITDFKIIKYGYYLNYYSLVVWLIDEKYYNNSKDLNLYYII